MEFIMVVFGVLCVAIKTRVWCHKTSPFVVCVPGIRASINFANLCAVVDCRRAFTPFCHIFFSLDLYIFKFSINFGQVLLKSTENSGFLTLDLFCYYLQVCAFTRKEYVLNFVHNELV